MSQNENLLVDLKRKLTDIAGIGKGIASVIIEILERKSFEKRDHGRQGDDVDGIGRIAPLDVAKSALVIAVIGGLGRQTVEFFFDAGDLIGS